MVPSGDMSTYLRQKPSSTTGLLLFGDLAGVGVGSVGRVRQQGDVAGLQAQEGSSRGTRLPNAHAS